MTAKLRSSGLSKLNIKRRLISIERVYEQNTTEFLKNTTIHGLQYINRKDLSVVERLYFALSFITVVLLSGYFMFLVYVKWTVTPVIFSLNPDPTFVTKEPFPAVTVCNLNQAIKSKVDHLSVFSTEFTMLHMLCNREVNPILVNKITDWSMVKNFILNISQPCSSMILECRFGATKFNCTDLFHPIVTDKGLCCTFNMVDPRFLYRTHNSYLDINVTHPQGYVPVNWSVESGYPKELPQKFVPFTSFGIGESLGLSITLNVDADEYYCSSSNGVGFKMSLHNPIEIPNVHEIGLLISAGRETKVRVAVDKTESDPKLRDMDKNKRQCLFQDESHLETFSHYTDHNCAAECMTKIMLATCGCITHFMAELKQNASICSIYDAKCVESIRLLALSDTQNKNCYDFCMPSCYSLTFLGSVFTTPLTRSDFDVASTIVKNLSNAYVQQNIAVVHLYLKDYSFRSNKQTEFIGAIDVLSSAGGLICIFFGFSFISLTEFIFYAIIRPCRTRQQTVQEQRVGSTEAGKPCPPLATRTRNRFHNPFKFSQRATIATTTEHKQSWSGENYTLDEQIQQNMLAIGRKRKLQQEMLSRWYQQRNQ